MKKALIIGFTDQDGSYLAEFLLNKGYESQIKIDSYKPEGTLRKKIVSQRLNSVGWQHKVSLHHRFIRTFKASLNNL